MATHSNIVLLAQLPHQYSTYSAHVYMHRFHSSGFVQKPDSGFLDFSRTKLLLFPHFSRHFVHLYVNKNITKLSFKRWNFLYNVFFSYSEYLMGLKFLNSELQMLCVMNCKKINKCIGNQQCNKHLYFPGQHYSFQRFFQTFPYLWSFSRLFKALKISILISRTFHTFPGSVKTLNTGTNLGHVF